MDPLVSVLIPCYNAGKWVAEAIQSALDQTWPQKEVIAIDDGSTDASVDVIRSFGQRIRWETGPNRGGNHARNRGFELSRGDVIQFLDADDFILPQKVQRQVEALQVSGAGIVYEDWQRFDELNDGTRRWYPVEISGAQQDILVSLLGGWIPAVQSFLFSRSVLEHVGHWDEKLTSAQDWDLHIRLALSGVTYHYLPGCHSIVRRPAVPTVHTLNPQRLHDNVVRILQRTESVLAETGRMTEELKNAMALSYFRSARTLFPHNRTRFRELVREAQRLSTSFVEGQPPLYRAVASLVGVSTAEQLAFIRRRLKQVLGCDRPQF